MKKVSKFVMMLLMGAMTLGFSACSDSNDDPDNSGETATTEMGKIATTYVNDVVYPTYKDLASNAQTLYEACQNLWTKEQAKTLTQADIDAACEAFKNTRRYWEQSEAFLYGAASDNDIDPHIDSWPLDHDGLVSALNNADIIKGIKGENPDKFIYTSWNDDFGSVLGFHGLEFVLFRNGANRTLEAINAGKETETGLESVNTSDEIAFAAAVAGDLRNMIFMLEYGWVGANLEADRMAQLNNAKWVLDGTRYAGLSKAGIGYGEYLLKAGNGGFFSTWQETLQNIFVGGCSNICQEVYTQKLGQAYRVAIGKPEVGEEGEDSGDYIESPYSKRSFIDYQDNIKSIRNSLYGTREEGASPVANSLMTYLKNHNYEGYNTLSTALTEAIGALESAKNSGKAFIDAPGDPQVKNCIDKVNALDDALNEAGSWIAKQSDK